MQKKNRIFFLNLLIVIIIFLIDRVSKTHVIGLFDDLNSQQIFITSFLNIYLIWNEGIAFGLFSASHEYWYNFLTIVISFVAFTILIMSIRQEGAQKYFLLIVFGGALGNLYDRIFLKAVPDFIDLHVENYQEN